MKYRAAATKIDPSILVEIIRFQAEIAMLGLDLSEVMNFVASRAQLLTRSDGAVVEIADGPEMVFRATSGIAERALGIRLKRVGSLSGMCLERGKVLRCDDSELDGRVDREASRKVGLRSMIVAPLRHQGTPIGVLKVLSSEVNAFTENDGTVLELMTDLISACMFHARRHESDLLFSRATRDELTGIPNRSVFFDRLRNDLARADSESSHLSLLMIDMDGLKTINDKYGHRAGDAAIREVAARIHSALRATDTVARIGGDEFAAIIGTLQTKENLREVISRIHFALYRPFRFEGRSLMLDASIGGATYPQDGHEIDALMEHADQAMYRVKSRKQSTRKVTVAPEIEKQNPVSLTSPPDIASSDQTQFVNVA